MRRKESLFSLLWNNFDYPSVIALASKVKVIDFDINFKMINELSKGLDHKGEVNLGELKNSLI
tara:strand:- start:157 stop:345 length:189 start_codon:yes stop_codon:yes gene_type:complete